MSYQLLPPRPVRRTHRRRVPAPPVYPLGQPPLLPVPQQRNDQMKSLLIGIVVVLLLMALLWWINQRTDERPVERNRSRASKQSTNEMARNLYKRLEKRGGVNDTTMRSLKALGRKR